MVATPSKVDAAAWDGARNRRSIRTVMKVRLLAT